jgi:DNA-directed RNA polymerase specialized sigma24 family protein
MSQQNELLAEISEKLDKVLRLLALDVVKGYEKEMEKIDLLDSIGFRPIEIAKFLNKSQDNVNNRLNEIRKKRELASGKSKEKIPEKAEAREVKSEDTS